MSVRKTDKKICIAFFRHYRKRTPYLTWMAAPITRRLYKSPEGDKVVKVDGRWRLVVRDTFRRKNGILMVAKGFGPGE